MMETVINLLKSKSLVIPSTIFFNYKKLGLDDSELITLIYLLNQDENIFNLQKMSEDLGLDSKKLLILISSLTEKDIIKIDVQKKDSKCIEVIIFDGLYKKLSFLLVNVDKKTESENLYDMFEKEFGRTISPMEYEIINAWKDSNFSDEMIASALKEAIYNGVSNLRYIDKILHDWNKKGIKSKSDIEKERQNFNKRKEKTVNLIDYDWLNENE